jgi:glycosyltransferase involved in cell wall biosynthesis
MKILYVAYPLVKLGAESCGGAEQMLNVLEAGMASRGHETVVVGCAGSHIAGELVASCAPEPPVDAYDQIDAAQNKLVLDVLREARESGRPFDLVHDKGGSFWKLAASIPEPVLLTVHLGRGFYGDELSERCPNLFVNCVSEAQQRTFNDVPQMVGVVPNGVVLHRFPLCEDKDDYLLWLGRICEEKGTHIAIEVARRLRMRIIVAGDVYSFSYHQRYFEREVLPRVRDGAVQLVIRPRLENKAQLLSRARAVLIPSLVDETSSLVSMEAAACGTPVVAFRRGALPEVIEEGETGLLVDTPEQMAEAVLRSDEIAPGDCRRRAEQFFDSRRMVTRYEALYWRVRHLQERQSQMAA